MLRIWLPRRGFVLSSSFEKSDNSLSRFADRLDLAESCCLNNLSVWSLIFQAYLVLPVDSLWDIACSRWWDRNRLASWRLASVFADFTTASCFSAALRWASVAFLLEA